MRRHRAEVRFIQRVHPELIRVGLAAPGICRDAVPGQFYMVRTGQGDDPFLPRAFALYRKGLGGEDGEEGREDGLQLLVRLVGRGSRFLSLRRPGDVLELLGPLGRGWRPEGQGRPVLVGGGVGVATLVSLVQSMDPGWRRSALALLGGRTRDHVWGREELEEMGVAVQAAVEHGGGGFPGTVVELLQARERELPVPGARLLACGPPGMLKRVALWGLARGIPCQVSLEAPMACGVGVCLGCAVKRPGDRGYTRLCREGPVMDAADVDWECIGGL